jgi:hypothetical protein
VPSRYGGTRLVRGVLVRPFEARQKNGRLKYLCVTLHGSERVKQCVRVHTLVLKTFVGPRPPGLVSRHLDGNPANNCVANLVWDTQQENMRDRLKHGTSSRGEANGHAVLTEEKVREIRRIGYSMYAKDIATLIGCKKTVVDSVRLRASWAWVDP